MCDCATYFTHAAGLPRVNQLRTLRPIADVAAAVSATVDDLHLSLVCVGAARVRIFPAGQRSDSAIPGDLRWWKQTVLGELLLSDLGVGAFHHPGDQEQVDDHPRNRDDEPRAQRPAAGGAGRSCRAAPARSSGLNCHRIARDSIRRRAEYAFGLAPAWFEFCALSASRPVGMVVSERGSPRVHGRAVRGGE
jgi:hypothetical protein